MPSVTTIATLAGRGLDRDSAEPLYRQLADLLAAAMSTGELAVGQRLPSEPELMERYGIGRITVRQAIELLRQSGKLTVQRGKGTFVAARVVRHDLDSLHGFYDSLRLQGIEPHTTLLAWQPTGGVNHPDLPPDLDLPARLQRLYAIEDKPFAIVTGYLPAGASKLKQSEVARLSVYDILDQVLGTRVDQAEVTIRCEAAPGEIANQLNLPRGRMALVMERQSLNSRGQPCEFMRIHIVPQRYEFRVRVQGQFDLARAVRQVIPSRNAINRSNHEKA
jgi:GntR family transcriptional regulator